jgi:nucleoside-triphosphatase
LKKRVLLLTGGPGIGKTTVLFRVVDALKDKGITVGGMGSREARSGGARIGFEVLDLNTGRHGWLARVDQTHGQQVGKYHVNLEDLDRVGVVAILNAVRDSDVVAIDEIGPMELFSEGFKEAVGEALGSAKLVIGIVHWKTRDLFTGEINARSDAETYAVTRENREHLHEVLTEKALKFLSRADRE